MAAEQHPENCNVCELSDDTTAAPHHRMGYDEDDVVVVRQPRMSTGVIIAIVVSVLLIIATISLAVWCSCSSSTAPQFGGGKIRGGSAPVYLPSSISSMSSL